MDTVYALAHTNTSIVEFEEISIYLSIYLSIYTYILSIYTYVLSIFTYIYIYTHIHTYM